MIVHDDLDTLHVWADHQNRADVRQILARVEAEIARLERENAHVLRNVKDEAVQTIMAKEYGSEQFHRAEAAEAEVARLRDGLRRIEQMALRDESGIVSVARALLADQDGAA